MVCLYHLWDFIDVSEPVIERDQALFQRSLTLKIRNLQFFFSFGDQFKFLFQVSPWLQPFVDFAGDTHAVFLLTVIAVFHLPLQLLYSVTDHFVFFLHFLVFEILIRSSGATHDFDFIV